VTAAAALPRQVVFTYGLPGLIASLPVLPVTVLLPAWYAQDLGLGFVLTGAVLGLARLLDFASDLVVGILCDRLRWRGQRYRHLVIGGAALAGSGLLMLALPPVPAGGWWLGFGSIVLFTGWTIMMVPYTAWGAELSDDLHDRSRLTAARELAGLIGMLAALALTALLADTAVSPMTAIALFACGAGVPVLLLFSRFVPEPAVAGGSPTIRLQDVRSLWRFRAFRTTLQCWLINGVANGLPAVLFPVVVADYFGFGEAGQLTLLLGYFAAAVLAMPLWLGLARRYGKVNAWAAAIVINVICFSQTLWLDSNTAVWFVAVCLASGATLGADLALPPSIQADVLSDDRMRSGRRRTATAFGCWSMATKLALALAVAVGFIGLGAAPTDTSDATLPGSDKGVLLGLYVVLPVILKLGAMVLLLRLREHLSDGRNPLSDRRERPPEERYPLV